MNLKTILINWCPVLINRLSSNSLQHDILVAALKYLMENGFNPQWLFQYFYSSNYRRKATSAWKIDFGLPQNFGCWDSLLPAGNSPCFWSSRLPCIASLSGPQHSRRLYFFELEWKYTRTMASISSWISLKRTESPYSTASRTKGNSLENIWYLNSAASSGKKFAPLT